MDAPALRRRECHVWWAGPADSTHRLEALLGADERDRLSRLLRRADRDRFMVGCALLRLVAARYLDVAPEAIPISRTCPRCGGPHGKPRLALPSARRIEVSISHSGQKVAAAFAVGTPVGVDVEQIRTRIGVGRLAGTVLSPVEADVVFPLQGRERARAFLVYWTRKEAVLKALGVGLAASLRDVGVTGPGSPPRLLSWAPDPTLPGRISLSDLAAGTEHVASLAVIGGSEGVVQLDGSALIEEWVDGPAPSGRSISSGTPTPGTTGMRSAPRTAASRRGR